MTTTDIANEIRKELNAAWRTEEPANPQVVEITWAQKWRVYPGGKMFPVGQPFQLGKPRNYAKKKITITKVAEDTGISKVKEL